MNIVLHMWVSPGEFSHRCDFGMPISECNAAASHAKKSWVTAATTIPSSYVKCFMRTNRTMSRAETAKGNCFDFFFLKKRSREIWLKVGASYPSWVDHAFRSSSGSRWVHDEQRMAERKLLKLQLRKRVALATPRRQEIINEFTATAQKPQENIHQGFPVFLG